MSNSTAAVRTISIPDRGMALYFGITIFFSAFLLFQVQLILAKHILPWFGGVPAVWTVCMLFFQVLLLAGYVYAHWLAGRNTLRQQRTLHIALVVMSLVPIILLAWTGGTPLLPGESWKPVDASYPEWHIIVILGLSIGLPFFVLSSTNPLLQYWLSAHHGNTAPYRYYSLSNLGSLLGLVSYPVLIEVWLPLTAQAWLWVAVYAVFLFGIVRCSASAKGSGYYFAIKVTSFSDRPDMGIYLLWFGLAACASIVLLAVTNQIGHEVVVIPFLWIVPLVLYLLSFILSFGDSRWYRRSVFGTLMILVLISVTLLLSSWMQVSVAPQILIYSVAVFVISMVCHGELARLKPHPVHLTRFYLILTLGGATGGLFVGLIAPRLFDNYSELGIGLWLSAALLFMVMLRDRNSLLRRVPGKTVYTTVAATALAIFTTVQIVIGVRSIEDTSSVSRNFYGVLTVTDEDRQYPDLHVNALYHGSVVHGLQYRAESRRREPTTYYIEESGVGLLLRHHPRRQQPGRLRVGVIGLGVGTLAAYGEVGDEFRFYEVDPAVGELAFSTNGPFTFVRDTPAKTQLVLGDARVSLERELQRGERQQFDILVLDAFTNGSIPVHLLTREAFEIYLQHLNPDKGALAVHISNAHLDLEPVLWRLSEHFNLTYYVVNTGRRFGIDSSSHWVLLSPDIEALNIPAIAAHASMQAPKTVGSLWTDSYSNLLQITRFLGEPHTEDDDEDCFGKGCLESSQLQEFMQFEGRESGS